MRSILAVSTVLILLALMLVLGCSKGGDPITPDGLERDILSFYDYQQVFPESGQITFRDTDLATLVYAETGSYADSGSPAVLEYDSEYVQFCIQVSLEIGIGTKVPWLAWMINDDGGGNPAIVDRREFAYESGPLSWDYKYPKVAAIYKEEATPEDSRVKVAVSGMVLLPNASSWSVGVWFMEWSGDDFENGTMGDPDNEWGVLVPANLNALQLVDRVDVYSQDIAFDPETGDLWLIYASDDHTNGNPIKLKCRKYVEDESAWEWTEDEDYRGYAYDPGIDCSCYYPSVDIGAITLDATFGWYVAVAFTALNHPSANATLCLAGNYWLVTETGNHEDNDFVTPQPSDSNI